MSALEDRVLAVVSAAPEGSARFAEVLVRCPDELPVTIFETLRRLAHEGRLVASSMGPIERPMAVRYRTPRRTA